MKLRNKFFTFFLRLKYRGNLIHCLQIISAIEQKLKLACVSLARTNKKKKDLSQQYRRFMADGRYDVVIY